MRSYAGFFLYSTNMKLQLVHHLNGCILEEVFMFIVKGKEEYHLDGQVMMTPMAKLFLINILKLDPDKVS